MTNKSNFVFFDSGSTSGTSEKLQVSNNGDSITVEVRNAGGVKFEGCLDPEANTWYDLAAVNLSDYQITSTIAADGLYMVIVGGVRFVRAVATDGVGSMYVGASMYQ